MFSNGIQLTVNLLTILTIAVIPAFFTVRRIYRQTTGSRATLVRQLGKLSCGIRSEFVDTIFGSPRFARTKGDLTERVYETPHAYVQTVADSDGSIAWWAVTTIDKRFRPRFTLPPMTLDGQQWSVQLGRTRFAQLEEPRLIRWFVGARRFWYAETYYFGNPGNYLTYVASHSDLGGVGDLGFDGLHGLRSHARGKLSSGELIIECPQELTTTLAPMVLVRQSTVINTFGVGNINIDLKDFRWTLGADSDQVRLLHSTTVSHSGLSRMLLLHSVRARSKWRTRRDNQRG